MLESGKETAGIVGVAYLADHQDSQDIFSCGRSLEKTPFQSFRVGGA